MVLLYYNPPVRRTSLIKLHVPIFIIKILFKCIKTFIQCSLTPTQPLHTRFAVSQIYFWMHKYMQFVQNLCKWLPGAVWIDVNDIQETEELSIVYSKYPAIVETTTYKMERSREVCYSWQLISWVSLLIILYVTGLATVAQENVPSDVCAQRKFRSACTFLQSYQNLTGCVFAGRCKVSSLSAYVRRNIFARRSGA